MTTPTPNMYPAPVVPWWGILAHIIMAVAMSVVPLAGVWTENVLWRLSPPTLSAVWIAAAVLCSFSINRPQFAIKVALPVVAALHATMGLGSVLMFATHYTPDGAEMVRVGVTAAMHAAFTLYAVGLAHWTAKDLRGAASIRHLQRSRDNHRGN